MLRTMLMEALDKWEEKASGTETPVDDILFSVIRAIIEILV